MNKFIGIGRLTKDVELRTTNSGKSVMSNSIAIRNDYKNADGDYDSEFINIQVWGKTAEYLYNYARKGSPIAIEGRVQTRSYDDADGNTRYTTEVVCNSVELLESKKTAENNADSVEHTAEANDPYAEYGDSIDIDDNFLD